LLRGWVFGVLPPIALPILTLLAAQISTERLTISSLASASPNTTSLTPAFPLSLITRGPALPSPPPAGTSYPAYSLTLDYSHSSNNGKSIIHQALVTKTQCFGEFFDVEGKLAKSKLEAELQKLLAEVVGQ
jgi:signal peptidase complex subunit 2